MEGVTGVRWLWMRQRLAYMTVLALLAISNTTTYMYATRIYNNAGAVKCESTRRLVQLSSLSTDSVSQQIINTPHDQLRDLKHHDLSRPLHNKMILRGAPVHLANNDNKWSEVVYYSSTSHVAGHDSGIQQHSDTEPHENHDGQNHVSEPSYYQQHGKEEGIFGAEAAEEQAINITDDSLDCAPCQCTGSVVTNVIYENNNSSCQNSSAEEAAINFDRKYRNSSTQNDKDLKTIFVITPTYHRTTQKIDLTSMCHTLMLVPKVVWVIIEDSKKPTKIVSRLIKQCQVEIVHLLAPTSSAYKVKKGAPAKSKPRGVEQRNAGLNWLRQHYSSENCNGVFYFGDDDNKYDLRMFEDIRKTEHASVWKVAWAGGLRWEGPVCKNGRAKSWHSWFAAKSRAFPLDMAGFAIHLCELFKHPKARVGVNVRGHSSKNGYLESDFLQHFASKSTVECRGSETETYVWHSHTSSPSLHFEKRSHSNKVVETQ